MCSCRQKETLFMQMPASGTGIGFENKLEERDGFGILYYIYYYNGGGVATGDINNDGLPDIYFTANNPSGNKLYLNKGNFKFEDITEVAGVPGNSDWCTGVTMADVNADGWLDIYVSAVANVHGLAGRNELFINNRNNTFTERAEEYGLNFSGFSTQAAFFDYDHDGDLDCYMLNQSFRPDDNIVDTSNRRKIDPLAGDLLLRNDMNAGSGKFVDVSKDAGIYQSSLGYGLGLGIADLNNDGWEDIYVGNDFHENDYYYLNNRDGSFSESGAAHFGHYSRFSMGNDIADYNNDGQPDIVTVDMLPPDEKVLKTYGSNENPDIYKFKLTKNGFQDQYSRNALQTNNGNGRSFSETGLLAGISASDWSWSPLFADFDNDGKKDLFISSGIVKRPVDLDFIRFVSNLAMQKSADPVERDRKALEKMPDGSSHPFLFRGDGINRFKDFSVDWGTGDMRGYFNGAACADFDNDGKLDLVINQLNGPAVMLRNTTSGNNQLTIKLKGSGRNTFGIGTKLYLLHHGTVQYQQLMITRGFQSASEERLHFGLDTLNAIDSVLVVWPDQRYQVLLNIPANKLLQLSQEAASGAFVFENWFPAQASQLSKIDNPIKWSHRENVFDDFNVQYLLPHAESTRGPKMAIGDINRDGLDDIFICGAKGQASVLYRQVSNGNFLSIDTATFSADKASEDVDALFFDANGDGHLDLYVVAGGNELGGKDSMLLDRLYINSGTGRFLKSSGALPPIFMNKSCVAAADIDKDGDTDLFVGVLADAHAYGIPQTSYLLLNDSKGRFSIAGSTVLNLKNIGIVTSASFADLDKNGWPDLVIAGEWMPILVCMNVNGKFSTSSLDHSSGQWQTVSINDVDGDGSPDILAGNWGLNNKFSSNKNGPLRLYAADFDGNKRVDQLISYTKDGEEFPFLAKDEVEKALPVLKKHYLLYADYAGVPMKEVFYGYVDKVTPLTCEKLASVICYGDGKGGFEMVDLPDALQRAPIFSFSRVETSRTKQPLWIAGGNFFDVIPYEGKYDAQALSLFQFMGRGAVIFPDTTVLSFKGQVRDIKTIKTNTGRLFIAVAANNSPLEFLTPNNQKIEDAN
jgi:enediyne biosynthesis protein E4